MLNAVSANDGARRAELADSAIRRVRRVAMLPDVTLRIIELMQDHDYTSHELEKLVSTDPALCLRILKVVNSAFYGTAGRIGTIQRAVIVLGGPAIRNIAIATSVGAMLRGKVWRGEASPRALWRHSLAVAGAARLAATVSGRINGDEAFLAGLLHDIGFVIELQVSHARESAAAADAQLVELLGELSALAVGHHDYGYSLARNWRLPDSIADAIGSHHDPATGPAATLPQRCVVHLADVLAHKQHIGFVRDPQAQQLQRPALSALGLDNDDVEQIAATLAGVTEELEATLS